MFDGQAGQQLGLNHVTDSFVSPILAPEPHGLDQKIPATSYVYAVVDYNNKVAEDVEDNNYASLNPNVLPFPQNAATYCKPHPVKPVMPQP